MSTIAIDSPQIGSYSPKISQPSRVPAMPATIIPTTTSLDEIYPSTALSFQTTRWNRLLSTFQTLYSQPADFVSRSPGRVNLIGEHIDYSLYPVIPMAVEQDVLLAVCLRPHTDGPRPPKIRLQNLDSGRFKPHDFELNPDGSADIDATKLEWSNYFKAGLKGATELLAKLGRPTLSCVDVDVLATGTVPAGGGMSSSAAFVCASALAVVRAAGLTEVDKKALVETAVVSERSVGVNSGGMDQSASVFGERGSALYVKFVPGLEARAVGFPELKEPLTFVVAQSLVAADKHVSAPVCYNLRVVECTLASLVLGKITGVSGRMKGDSSPLGMALRTFHDAFFEGKESEETDPNQKERKQLEELLKLVDDYLPQEEGYTREQISDILGTPIKDLEEKYMTKFPVRADRFKLRQRAMHVFSEALRMMTFLTLLEGSAPQTEEEGQNLLKDLGDLLNQTQDSCRDAYECSCPELDELCQLARGAGAVGSRLTGAGWGGCSVHLVPASKVEAVKKAWTDNFYKKRFPDITDEKLSEAIVVSKPGRGSCLFDVKGREGLS
ncbi:Galactokinase [Sphaceloma murrayae]|uniref:Galactokinase n=1 Tax=Sphaceloma murrayae TaxID=2082308 RepID=A0A2K1QWI6_9PEZI|nr:Galactokinase [Sphaceloma murrayae]